MPKEAVTKPAKPTTSKGAKPAKDAPAKLTLKQSLFIKEYLCDLNATQAAIRAGYSEKTAQVIGAENLTKPVIADAIQKAMDERAGKLDITAERVLSELAKLGFGNIQNLYTDEGRLIPIHQLSPEVSATITEVTEKVISAEGENTVLERKYKISDKRAALVDLGKHLKLFTDKTEVTGANGGPIITRIELVALG
jgi:phage terminase small subunit